MIEPSKIASFAYGETVRAVQNRKSFLLIFTRDDAPTPSDIVTYDHIKNRSLVSQGKIVTWGEHGHIAVVENHSGFQAAFHCYELNN